MTSRKRSPQRPPSSTLFSSSSSSSNSPLLQDQREDARQELIDDYWIPVILDKLEEVRARPKPRTRRALLGEYHARQRDWLAVSQFEFLLTFTPTLTNKVRDEVLIRFIREPAQTIRNLLDDIMVDHPEWEEKDDAVKTTINRLLKRLLKTGLVERRIIDVHIRHMRKTQAWLAPWAKEEDYTELYNQYLEHGLASQFCKEEPKLDTEEEIQAEIQRQAKAKVIQAAAAEKAKPIVNSLKRVNRQTKQKCQGRSWTQGRPFTGDPEPCAREDKYLCPHCGRRYCEGHMQEHVMHGRCPYQNKRLDQSQMLKVEDTLDEQVKLLGLVFPDTRKAPEGLPQLPEET